MDRSVLPHALLVNLAAVHSHALKSIRNEWFVAACLFLAELQAPVPAQLKDSPVEVLSAYVTVLQAQLKELRREKEVVATILRSSEVGSDVDSRTRATRRCPRAPPPSAKPQTLPPLPEPMGLPTHLDPLALARSCRRTAAPLPEDEFQDLTPAQLKGMFSSEGYPLAGYSVWSPPTSKKSVRQLTNQPPPSAPTPVVKSTAPPPPAKSTRASRRASVRAVKVAGATVQDKVEASLAKYERRMLSVVSLLDVNLAPPEKAQSLDSFPSSGTTISPPPTITKSRPPEPDVPKAPTPLTPAVFLESPKEPTKVPEATPQVTPPPSRLLKAATEARSGKSKSKAGSFWPCKHGFADRCANCRAVNSGKIYKLATPVPSRSSTRLTEAWYDAWQMRD